MEKLKMENKEIYWNKKGKKQSQYDYLFGKYVPENGECKIASIEPIRLANKLYYDWYNNGFGNFTECYIDYGVKIVEFWDERNLEKNKFIELIREIIDEDDEDNETIPGYDKDEIEIELELCLDKIITIIFDKVMKSIERYGHIK